LPHQGEKNVFNIVRITGILEAPGGFLVEAVAVFQFAQQQAPGIRNYLTTLKIGDALLVEKAFKGELFMADCFHRVSLLRSFFAWRQQNVRRLHFFF
jgi:hypothetical protein